ncbi:MAG TPA: fatty acid desaturase [Bacteroidota bacterium]|nr:fatty acid desaturase [Bacteroidota bacterium]
MYNNQTALPAEAATNFDSTGNIYFCSDKNLAKEITRSDFGARRKQEIRRLHVLDMRWNAVIILHYAIWLTAGYCAVQSRILVADLIFYLVAGMSLSTLSVLAHESSHNLFTRNPRIDRLLGFFCGLPVLFSVAGYRVVHPLHHKFLHTKEDPDDIENVSRNPVLLRFVYLFVFIAGVYLYLVTVPMNALRRGTREERFRITIEALAMAAFVACGWFLLPHRIMLKGWLYPLLVAGQIANLRGLAEHGMTTGGNEFTDTRTVATHPVISFMMCNINYHLEHHLYPGIPWYNLPKVHALLQEEYVAAGSSVYQSYVIFLWDVAKVLARGVTPGTRLIPNHIREVICL